jgi:hypothetical protein
MAMNTVFIKGLLMHQELDVNRAIQSLQASESEKAKVVSQFTYLINHAEIEKVKSFYQYTLNIVDKCRQRDKPLPPAAKKPNFSHYDVAATKLMIDNQLAQMRAATPPPPGYFQQLRSQYL